jgi:hypothetical protein
MAEDDDDVWESDKDERSEEEIVRGGGARSTSELDREWQARQAQFHTVSSLSLSLRPPLNLDSVFAANRS